MLEVKIYDLGDRENLPDEIKDYYDLWEPVGGYDFLHCLAIYKYGKLVTCHTDGGEVEDATFGRDWYWVKPTIENAYKQGKEDAYIEQNK